ncbi:MAG TPA: transporter [Bacteroidales bacterium]|nr:MAG: hypothetical protein BWX62_00481 [Bacteroidetes bacterium ADurb.Bin037]HPV88125.1 transporter [Bacteroidales bacterium]HPW78475.1 transporter [Bacteroidales bacterium]HQB55897.1 transporter [Bacteroidales bacterium]
MGIKAFQFEKIRPFALPFALLLGFLFHGLCRQLQFVTPYLIFLILFMTLCDIDIRKVRVRSLHIWLVLFQLGAAACFYFIFLPVNKVLAQGAMMGVLAPVAVSSTVIAVMLGARMENMITYTILYNIVLALTTPLIFSFVGHLADLSFWASSWLIIRKVAPIIVFPLGAALLCQRFFPRLTKGIVRYKTIPFYLWAVALILVIGQTIDFIYHQDRSGISLILVMFLISLVQCILQFAFGRWLGNRYGDKVAGGQALGQKNALLAVWMTQMYLHPMASVVPASYVLWQNIWNSFQLWRIKGEVKAPRKLSQDATA